MSIDYKDPKYYENRELSWLKFNERILNEARDAKLPLLDRFKFLSITASNLDEFFMVRVASLVDMVHAGYKKKDLCGMTAQEQLDAVRKATHDFVDRQYSTLNRSLLPVLQHRLDGSQSLWFWPLHQDHTSQESRLSHGSLHSR